MPPWRQIVDIKNKVFDVVGFEFNGNINVLENSDGVYVKFDGKDAVIGFNSKAQMARCYFLLAMHIKKGETSFEIKEKPVFDTVGPMLDMSRGKVMNVDGVKRYIDVIATLGMNMIMLYTEDLYEVEGYPMFGHLRGRYSIAELKELDDYAYSLGVEIIPCIQTLGHLAKYLRTAEGSAISDTEKVLLVGDQKTYDFIEAAIKAVRSAFRTQKIHLGMDEAYGMGMGKYFKLHGYRDEFEIFNEHLIKVLDISRKYFEKPMIWSDMLFNEPSGRQYNETHIVKQEIIDNLPKYVNIVYWYYYSEDEDYYDKVFAQHARFDNELSFAGGIWTWDGLAPNFTYTTKTTNAALKTAIKYNVKTIIATEWASGGAAADYMHAAPSLALFSEYCYKGENCTQKDIDDAAFALTGVTPELAKAISDLYLDLRGARSFNKATFYGDPLINLVDLEIDYNEALDMHIKAYEVLKKYPEYEYYTFYKDLFEIAIRKIDMYINLQKAYKAGDREYLELTAKKTMPELLEFYEEFYTEFKKYWNYDYKTFGIESYTQDIGGVILRLKDCLETVQNYLDGKINRIEALECDIIPLTRSWRSPTSYMNTFR